MWMGRGWEGEGPRATKKAKNEKQKNRGREENSVGR